jgi:Ca2+-binding RTX toxin-like protein
MAVFNGTTGNDSILGGIDPDTLYGYEGDDTLNGGAGIDNYYGGSGNDIFFTDNAAELVFENANGGTDLVIARAGYYLYANIENLTLASGAGDIFGVGNELSNIINGNEGNNLLLGGADGDVIGGAAGNDVIFGEDGNDLLNGGPGIDYLVGGIGNDSIAGAQGPDAIYGEDGNDSLIGGDNDFSTDILVGGAGNDTLDGDSGLGDYDIMNGGAGNDVYLVDTPADLTFEGADEGIDTVIANIDGAGYYLYAFVENLTLQGTTPFGVGNELNNMLTGSSSTNWLLGGAGNDTLNGRGGNDVLFGEAGADVFLFVPGTNGDAILDYVPGTDRIQLQGFGISGWAQLQTQIGEYEGTAFINLGFGDFVVINGITKAQLTINDFIIG